MFRRWIAWETSSWANGRDISSQDSFNIGWRNISKKELSTNVYSNGEVYFVGVLLRGLLNDYGRGNQFGEIVHDEPGEDFLENVLHLFAVKKQQTNGVL